jgi:hypothetical protein
MHQYDLHNNIKIVRSISPVAGAATGKVIDRAGYAGVEIEISYGRSRRPTRPSFR